MVNPAVIGLREAHAAFRALPQIVRDRTNGATETTVREIARHAQGNLQASPSIQTRALYMAVAWTLNRKTGRGKVGISNTVTVIAGRGGSALRRLGARRERPSRRAHFIEFGTRHMPAEPFMIPAAESQKQPYLQRCREAGKGIEQDMAKIGLRHL